MPRPKIAEPSRNLTVRVKDTDRRLIAEGAAAAGMLLSEFVRAAAVEAATQALQHAGRAE